MSSRSAYSPDGLALGTQALRLRMTQRALYGLDGIDARSLTVLQRHELLKKTACIRLTRAATDVLCDPCHQDRVDVPPGPLLFHRVDGDDRRVNVLLVPDLLFCSEHRVRAGAYLHLDEMRNSDQGLTTRRTAAVLEEQRTALMSHNPKQWRQAAVAVHDAVEDDFLCNLAGLRQCLVTGLEDKTEQYLTRVLCPAMSSLDAAALAVPKPSEQQGELSAIIDQCVAGAESLPDACGLYYQKLGHLPLGNEFSLGALAKRWIDRHGPVDATLDELWAWADTVPSPLPGYHTCAALAMVPDLLTERCAPRLFDEIRSVMCLASGSDCERSGRDEAWLLWCRLAAHYARHLESHLPEQDGERICNTAWWLAERVGPVIPLAAESVAQRLSQTGERLMARSDLVWNVANPAVRPSGLRFATLNLRSPWSIALQCAMGRTLAGLRTRGMPEDLQAEVTKALSASLYSVFPLNDAAEDVSAYAFDRTVAATAEAWADAIPDSEHRALLRHLIESHRSMAWPESLLIELKGLATKTVVDQLLIAAVLRVMAYGAEIPCDDIWQCVSHADWCREVLVGADIRALEYLFDALGQIQVRYGGVWRSHLPHCYAYACEQCSIDSERRAGLFGAALMASLSVDTMSAVERLLNGELRGQLAGEAVRWRELLSGILPAAPPWLAGRIRATLAGLQR